MTSTRAFTAIETLFFVSLFILAAVAIPSALRRETIRQNDEQRMADLRSIQAAVNQYDKANGHYPNTKGSWTSFDSKEYSPNSVYGPNAPDLTAALSPYTQQLRDPVPQGGDSGYLYLSYTGDDYCIMAWRTPEDMNDFTSDEIPARCGSVSGGECTSGANAVFIGTGQFSTGC